jgi:dTDP-glucose 4,6-dehydratase
MKKAIVTGGLGFIGSNLIKLLLKKNYKIINLDKISYSSNFYNTIEFKNNKNYKFIKCDINQRKKISILLKKFNPNIIFNLAAETHVDRSIDSPENFIKSNIMGVYNLLEILRQKKFKNIKLIHVSTDEVYGDVLKGRSIENSKYNPSSPYAASKASADHLVKSYVKTYNLNAIITNCSNNYGPKQHPEKFIPKMIYNILNNKNLPIYGDGKNSREWIYVLDHCEALIKISSKGKRGQNYNIGSKKNMSNLNICKILIRLSNKIKIKNNSKIKFIKDRPGHDFRYALNSNKILKKIKWLPKTSIEQGLYKTIKWYLNNIKYYETFPKKDIIKRLGLK